MIELLSTNPARVMNVPGGALREGTPADITILAPDTSGHDRRVDAASPSPRTRRSTGWEMKGAVVATMVGGRIVYRAEGV